MISSMDITGWKKPIFIIGCPRSGTGIFQNLMKFHPDLSYVTPATDNLFGFLANNGVDLDPPTIILKLMDWYVKNSDNGFVPERFRPYDGPIKGDELPIAVEPPGIWTVIDDHFDRDYLTEEDVIKEQTAFLRNVISYHNRYFDVSRFLNKRPKDSLRIRYLNKIFPDAIFIHLIRDGRAVANSIYYRRKEANKDWFGARPPGWKEIRDKDPISQCAWQWKKILEIIKNDSKKLLDDSRYLKVKYEDITSYTKNTMEKVFDFCELNPEKAMRYISKYFDILESRNYKWKENLSHKQKRSLNEEIKSTLKKYGYE